MMRRVSYSAGRAVLLLRKLVRRLRNSRRLRGCGRSRGHGCVGHGGASRQQMAAWWVYLSLSVSLSFSCTSRHGATVSRKNPRLALAWTREASSAQNRESVGPSLSNARGPLAGQTGPGDRQGCSGLARQRALFTALVCGLVCPSSRHRAHDVVSASSSGGAMWAGWNRPPELGGV